MSDPIWGPKGFWADYNAARNGRTTPPSGNPWSEGSFTGQNAKRMDLLIATNSSGRSTPGDSVGGIIAFGGIVFSIIGMIEAQDPRILGVGILLSAISGIAVKIGIDSDDSKPSSLSKCVSWRDEKKPTKIITEDAAFSAGHNLHNKIELYLSNNHLETYLGNDGADKLPLLKRLINQHAKYNGEAKSAVLDSDVEKVIYRLKYGLDDGSLQLALYDMTKEGRLYRSDWTSFLKDIPSPNPKQDKKQAAKEMTRPAMRKRGILFAAFMLAAAGVGIGFDTGKITLNNGVVRLDNQIVFELPFLSPQSNKNNVLPEISPSDMQQQQAAPSPLLAFTHVVNTKDNPLNMRVGPGDEFPVRGSLARNSCVRGVGQAVNGWQQISLLPVQTDGAPRRYVSANFIRELRPGETCR